MITIKLIVINILYIMEKYEYKVNTLECMCNTCNSVKLCLQCNECSIMTCVGCINIIKCNNCNNLFTKYELELIGYKNYDKNIDKISCKIVKHLKLYDINLSKYTNKLNDKMKELRVEIGSKLRELLGIIYEKLRITKDKKLVNLFSDISFNRTIGEYEFIKYDINLSYDEIFCMIIEINKLICKYKIYDYCLYFNTSIIIYCDIDIEKLDHNIRCYIGKENYLSIKYYQYKSIVGLACVIESNCNGGGKHNDDTRCGKVCKYYLKYYEDVRDKIICPMCNYYNFMFEKCSQIYCNHCGVLYDMISGKIEEFVRNPIVIYRYNDKKLFGDKIIYYKFNEFIRTIPSKIVRNIKNIKKWSSGEYDKNLNIYKMFYKYLDENRWD